MMDERDEREQQESSVSALRAELGERNKELAFLHHAARLLNMRGEPRDILRAVLELLPSAMSQPDLACARLSLGALEITTRGYESSELNLRVEQTRRG